MPSDPLPSDVLPTDLAAAHAMILAQRDLLVEARLAAAQAQSFKLEIERLKLQLEKARRARFGQSSERGKQIVSSLNSPSPTSKRARPRSRRRRRSMPL